MEQYKCWISQYITFGLLASLQAVNLFWGFLILKIAKNYMMSGAPEDVRSDDEDEEDEAEGGQTEKKLLEAKTGMETDKPVLLQLNGKPLEGHEDEEKKKQKKVKQAVPQGVRERRKRG